MLKLTPDDTDTRTGGSEGDLPSWVRRYHTQNGGEEQEQNSDHGDKQNKII